ncbi:MAG: hypothetical protein U9Q20_02465 [Campylobacterota bacterium]|nr:hypothetical protein [Campylobacterota bacterium]
MSFYNIFDLLFIVLNIFLILYSYKHRSYIKIFEYFKIFFLITVSAKLSSITAVLLQKLYITKADTYTTLILISFVVNLLIIYFSWKFIFKFSKRFVNSEKLKILFAKIFTVVEVVVLSTFSLYILMQIYITKVYLAPTLKKTYTYSKVIKFYNSFLNDDFVNMILHSDTGTNHKEIIFKSFKNSI